MESLLFSGVFDLPWWGYLGVALLLTHVTIVCVTIYLHRCQTHRALTLHPVASHLFRFWLWLTTGMVTREWVAVHRKHHAKRETVDDPHSPQVLGINRVLWGGVFLYVRETHNRETIERYGYGAPDDWLERRLYSRYVLAGLTLMGVINVALFGVVPGVLILLTQIVWIPFWAAGVINGAGHYWGYRNWVTADASTNLVPWGILIGGEELHNNHHAFPTSATFSNKWYEIDIGWAYIRALTACGLAQVKRVAPVAHFKTAGDVIDVATVQAVIAHRYDVLATYASALRATNAGELAHLQRFVSQDPGVGQSLNQWIEDNDTTIAEPDRTRLIELLSRSRTLLMVYSMRRELVTLWERHDATKEQLVRQMQGWCERAESSGIAPLAAFSQRLRRYA